MSHTHTHIHTHAHHASLLPTARTVHMSRMSRMPLHEELRRQWDQLPLHPQTRAHLEQVLITQGAELASAATLALSLELAREEQQITRSLWGWLLEELRLLFLEEGCQHLIEAGRLLTDVVLAWLLVQGPWLLSRLVGPLLLLLVLPVVLCLHAILRSAHSRQR